MVKPISPWPHVATLATPRRSTPETRRDRLERPDADLGVVVRQAGPEATSFWGEKSWDVSLSMGK